MRVIIACAIGVFLSLGCSSETSAPASTEDCRNESKQCAKGFTCRKNASDRYECQENGTASEHESSQKTATSGDVAKPETYTGLRGVIASGSWDNTIRLWNASDGRHLRTLKGHTGSVNSVTFSPR